MTRLFIRHNVRDYAPWRKVYDEFDEERGQMGVTGDALFQSIEDANDVTVWHDFDSAEAAHAFVTSEALKAAMQRGGVDGEPQIWFVQPS